METIKVTMKSDAKAGRLELIVRFIWGFICAIILEIIGLFAFLAVFVQWFHILILGKRHAALAKFVNSWVAALMSLYFYVLLGTDERPPLIPEF